MNDEFIELLGAEEVYALLPDLIMSQDDTTLFVFEGCAKTGAWTWKIVDKTMGDTSVHSNFEVGHDAENSGGLRVRLTFTFTASGLYAPLLISVCGLTAEELSPEKCPDGLLAAKLRGIGKADLDGEVWSMIYFLRADSKGNHENKKKCKLNIMNKKFMQYNHDIVLPFIQRICEMFGWVPGQPVLEWLEAIL